MLRANVFVTLKNGVVDPQGITIKEALESLGHQDIANVRLGKYIQLELNKGEGKEVEKEIKEMCQKLLANPVIENYRYEIEKEHWIACSGEG